MRDDLSLKLSLTIEFLEPLVNFSIIVFIIISCYLSHDLKIKSLKMGIGSQCVAFQEGPHYMTITLGNPFQLTKSGYSLDTALCIIN